MVEDESETSANNRTSSPSAAHTGARGWATSVHTGRFGLVTSPSSTHTGRLGLVEFVRLGRDTMDVIFSFLPPLDHVRLGKVCRFFRERAAAACSWPLELDFRAAHYNITPRTIALVQKALGGANQCRGQIVRFGSTSQVSHEVLNVFRRVQEIEMHTGRVVSQQLFAPIQRNGCRLRRLCMAWSGQVDDAEFASLIQMPLTELDLSHFVVVVPPRMDHKQQFSALGALLARAPLVSVRLVAMTGLPSELLRHLCGQRQLARLDLSETEWSDQFLTDSLLQDVIRSLPHPDQLRELKMHYSDIGDASIRVLGERCVSLHTLHVLGARVTDSGLQPLQALPLTDVSLRGCSEVSAAGLSKLLARLPRLKSLDIALTRVDDACLETLARTAPMLSRVDLSGCLSVSDAGLRHLGTGARQLTNLSLSGCARVSDEGVKAMLCSPLVRIGLAGNPTLTKHVKAKAYRFVGSERRRQRRRRSAVLLDYSQTPCVPRVKRQRVDF